MTECSKVVDVRLAGVSISHTLHVLGFSNTTISRFYRERSPVSGSCLGENTLLMSEVREK